MKHMYSVISLPLVEITYRRESSLSGPLKEYENETRNKKSRIKKNKIV